jgi:hypothetical protein
VGTLLFERQADLTVAPLSGGDGIKIEGLRIVFSVEKTSTSEANHASVQVYNLAEQTRGWLKSKDQAVVLNAGYLESSQRLFAGVIDRLEHEREGVDLVTTIECKDGGLDLRDPEFHRSYRAGTSKASIISDIVANMPHTTQGPVAALGAQGRTGGAVALSGTCKRVLDRLGRSWGYEWSIQDGVLQVLDEGEAATPEILAVKLTPTTGLIGSPTKTERGVKARSLLRPSLRPGSYLVVESEFLTGGYKAESVRHDGDTHGGAWNTETEARSLV